MVHVVDFGGICVPRRQPRLSTFLLLGSQFQFGLLLGFYTQSCGVVTIDMATGRTESEDVYIHVAPLTKDAYIISDA